MLYFSLTMLCPAVMSVECLNALVSSRAVPCLTEAKIDCAVLANNHMLDFGHQGLTETLTTLKVAGIKTAGAGRNIARASEPAILGGCDQKRALVYAFGHASSGVDAAWSADTNKPGVNFLGGFSDATLSDIQKTTAGLRRPGDVVILSIHWGSNWAYEVEETHRHFAHKLIDETGVDVVYGHSSHHVRGIERHHGKIIFYGCGDFIDDYEGISGYESFRDDLTLMYFLRLHPTDSSLTSLEMVPMQIKHLRLQRAARNDARWLYETLRREGKRLGAQFELASDDRFQLVC
jgi:poly-gamma-glutamate synthesis protein (capsule biosynthesis protein)